MNTKSYNTIRTNKPNGLIQSFSNIFNNKFLIYSLVRKNIVTSYSQSIIGPIYFLFLPLLQTFIFSFFLNNIFELNNNKTESFIFIYISMTYWSFFSNATVKCANSYLFNKRLITKVYFDRLIFFIQSILFSLSNFIINFFILITILFLLVLTNKGLSAQLTYKIFLLPIFIFYSCCFSIFIGIIVASLSIRIRDFLYGLGFFFQLILFISPVLYPLEKLKGYSYSLMMFNPFTFLLESFRWFFYPNYILDYKILIINIFYFFLLIIFSIFFYKKSNLILSDEI